MTSAQILHMVRPSTGFSSESHACPGPGYTRGRKGDRTMGNGHRVTFETSVSESDDGGPAKLFVWVRHFEGDEELTGRYEVFKDLAALDEFIARTAATGE